MPTTCGWEGSERVTSHFGLMVVFAFFVAVVFAVIARDDPKEQFKLGGKFFGGFVGVGLLLGWLMYPLPF